LDALPFVDAIPYRKLLMRTATHSVLLAALLLTSCAADKKIPAPPESNVIDVSQPSDLARDRELLEGIRDKQGYAKKVDAYRSAEGCSPVADFYTKFMRDTHWTELSASQPSSESHSTRWNPAGLTQFTQSWKYQSRHVYIVGSVPTSGSGCVVITAIYTKAHRTRYEDQ